jgi:hypothetical protein
MMLKDAAAEVRKAFAREIGSPSSFATSASLAREQFSQGTALGKHILSPHPDALANDDAKRGGHEGDGEGYSGSCQESAS